MPDRRLVRPGRLPSRFLAALLAALLGLALPAALHAQVRGEPRLGSLSDEIIARAVNTWNAPATRTVRGRFVVETTDTVAATLAVLDGPLIVRGTVRGDVLIINGDVRLDSTAHVHGSVIVVGGVLNGRMRGRVDGDMQIWRAKLAYREEDGRLVATDDATLFSRYTRWQRRAGGDVRDVLVTSAHTYNRVEGFGILAGPRLRLNRGESRLTFEALGIFRTGDRIAWERENLGHRLLAEFREGRDDRYVAVGARHIDEISAVESWSLNDAETGLAAFLFARDYRDYWNRFGRHVFVRAGGAHRSTLTLTMAREEWESRTAKNPLALFRSGRDWRANPGALEGTATLVGLTASVDTRNDPDQPRDGWFLQGDYERGHVAITAPADPSELSLSVPEITYGRVFFDLRRYNRIAPHTSVNLRLVTGGLLHGDALPAQRRLSVSGVDALPGQAFRALSNGPDVLMCNTAPETDYDARGRPASCDRILLLQAELKGDFRIGLFGAEQRTDDRRWYADGLRADGTWTVFLNSGRGWLVGPRDGVLTWPSGAIPLFDGWRSDIGFGVDFGMLGLYAAQPLNGPTRTPRVFVRLGSRF